MNKVFIVDVERTVSSIKTYHVNAFDITEAERIALKRARIEEFPASSVDHSIRRAEEALTCDV